MTDLNHIYVSGTCANCGSLMTFNPRKVPSVSIDGRYEPICRNCIDQGNAERRKQGWRPEIKILDGAYGGANGSD